MVDRVADLDPYEGLNFDKMAENQKQRMAERVKREWKQILKREDWNATGEAIDSIHTQSDERGDMMTVGEAIQLYVAEYGRPPTPNSPPPLQAIKRWARERDLSPNPDETFDEMVERVRWSIAREGIPGFAPGRRAFDNALEDEKKLIERKVEERVEEKEKK